MIVLSLHYGITKAHDHQVIFVSVQIFERVRNCQEYVLTISNKLKNLNTLSKITWWSSAFVVENVQVHTNQSDRFT